MEIKTYHPSEQVDIAEDLRVLPPQLRSPNVVFVYGSRVANVVWSEAPTAFVINDEVVARNYEEYFKLLWEQSAEPSEPA